MIRLDNFDKLTIYYNRYIINLYYHDTIKEKEEVSLQMSEVKKQIANKLIKATASYYANVACPLFTYQPKVGKGVKSLRKIKNKSN